MLDRLIGFCSSLLSPTSPNNNNNNINKSNTSGGQLSRINHNQQPPTDCFTCRTIGGGGLTALGGYIIYYTFQRRNKPELGGISIFFAGFVGSVVMTIGFMRLIGVNELFEEQKPSTRSVGIHSTETASAATHAQNEH